MVRHPTFDLEIVLSQARSLSLEHHAEACIRLNALSANGEAMETAPVESHSVGLLKLCLKNFVGDLDVEHDLIAGEYRLGLLRRFLVNSQIRRRVFVHHAVATMIPGYDEYEAWPLPDWLQWLYYPMKTSVSLKKLFFRGRA